MRLPGSYPKINRWTAFLMGLILVPIIWIIAVLLLFVIGLCIMFSILIPIICLVCPEAIKISIKE